MVASTGDDLGMNLLSGFSEVSGVHKFHGGQRVLGDWRTQMVSVHTSHDDHLVNGANMAGDSASWPTVVPYNSGFLALQEIFHSTPDPDWSPVTSIDYYFTYFNADGGVVWTRTYHPDDLGMTQFSVASWQSTVGGYYTPMLIAGNTNSKVLVLEQNAPGGDRYFWLVFDADGDFTLTEAFVTTPEYYAAGWVGKQIRCGTGYVVASNNLLYSSTLYRLMTLDNDLDIVGTGLQLPGKPNRKLVGRWNGVNAPHFVYSDGYNYDTSTAGDPTGWHARKITFDGVTPATLEAVTSGNTALDNWND